HLAEKEVHKIHPSARVCAYGHLGDGNLHFNLIEADGGDPEWPEKRGALFDAIYRALAMVGGSISAEHGIGQMKVEQLKGVKDPVALDVMADIKALFDPTGILNPGKVIAAQD
ncbi:MAG: FAD-linked oxidase C-terminal domain-containing protein, partial [Alphaproteobacteria bacterium]|nr:FAD-linked oxidase C-terminal domain-containing protein [Alphaproteobacteria bacterium]